MPLWSTGTVGHPGAHAVFQSDGNFVVYDPGGGVLWASNTVGRAVNGRLVLQDDGNLVIYDAAGSIAWDRLAGWYPRRLRHRHPARTREYSGACGLRR